MEVPQPAVSPAKSLILNSPVCFCFLPCTALDPHYKAMQALDNKMEAVRTALTASTKLLLMELSSDAAVVAVRGGAAALVPSEMEAAAKGAAAVAEAAVKEAGSSHEEMLQVS